MIKFFFKFRESKGVKLFADAKGEITSKSTQKEFKTSGKLESQFVF